MKTYLCCPKCYEIYPLDPLATDSTGSPKACSSQPTPGSEICNEPLWKDVIQRSNATTKTKEEPIRLYLYHELEDWISRLYSRADIETLLDNSLLGRSEDAEFELGKLKVDALRELCHTAGLHYSSVKEQLVQQLLHYNRKARRPMDDPPTEEELRRGFDLLEYGHRRKLSTLRKALLKHLCDSKGIGYPANCKGPELVNRIETWRVENGLVDQSSNIIRPKVQESNTSKKGTKVLGRETLKEVRDLEKTMMQKFCKGQILRHLLKPSGLPRELDELVKTWEKEYKADIRGTLRGDALTFNEWFAKVDETPTWGSHQLSVLPEDWYLQLQSWLRMNEPDYDFSQLSRSAFVRNKISRLGETYRTRDTTASDAYIYYRDLDGPWSAGLIQSIFSHTRTLSSGTERTQTFLLVSQYRPLPTDKAHLDHFRSYPTVAGKIYQDAYFQGQAVITMEQVICHFGRGDLELPGMDCPCFVALPLDRS
ncbi:hypothetical protein CVT26_001467 [Gymnopilus dilepis]|uniref:SAP domain-containing protein n=1 Tax=Gymnopilus dilepis TaxID=231916 RepID=A0A409WEF2_9AGAR|nr:hypothetical protein CVT26_001467 [Gymnopilus dilepis]